jgi:molecular chaperone DnaK (HSP70)
VEQDAQVLRCASISDGEITDAVLINGVSCTACVQLLQTKFLNSKQLCQGVDPDDVPRVATKVRR